MLDDDIQQILLTDNEISKIVSRLADEITEDYKDKNLLVVGILKGAFVFTADLIRKIKIPCAVEFMAASSYGTGSKSSGQLNIIKDINVNVADYDILIVEDILDSGNTLHALSELLNQRNAKSIKICSLFDKPDRRVAPVNLDYRGMIVPDGFIVGYGLDYNEKYRNLPYIGILKPSIYE